MNKIIYSVTFLILSLFPVSVWSDPLIVIDGQDSTPIIGATVISCSGVISGITDVEGRIGGIRIQDYPLTIQSLGYINIELTVPADTVTMSVDTLVLPEVIVQEGARPIVRKLSYVREYCTGMYGNDTVQLFTEYMAETFNVTEKVKGYKEYDASPHVRNKRSYARFVHKSGEDSVAVPQNDEDALSFFSMIGSLPNSKVRESDSLRYGLVIADTIYGKYSPKTIMRKTDDLFIIQKDALADYKNHEWSPTIFKLLGFTIDIKNLTVSNAYTENLAGVYDINDFLYATFGIQALGRGKWLKKILRSKEPVEMNCYFEIYPVSTSYLTIDEYKEARKDVSRIPFQTSPLAQPLHPSIQSLVNRIRTNR